MLGMTAVGIEGIPTPPPLHTPLAEFEGVAALSDASADWGNEHDRSSRDRLLACVAAYLDVPQAITTSTSLWVSVTGQLANKNLDSSEKFVIGGIYGVRAYPQGEGVGDSGWLANVEVRHQRSRIVRLTGFYDIGGVRYNKDAFAPGSTGQTLSSYDASAWRNMASSTPN